jgi:cyclophilin family peptidyl-prolyl cis-trans isomerase
VGDLRRSLAWIPLAAALACSGADAPPPPPPAGPSALERVQAAGAHDVAVLDLGELGSVRIELFPELAPRTVESFVKLAEAGFYDGTSFHRVIPGFMIQGGDPLTKNKDPRDDGTGRPGWLVPDEFSDYPHRRGTVSLAYSGRDSGGSQFFIVHQDRSDLDGRYSVFGRVVAGMETVDAVTQLEIDKYGRYGPPDRPYPKDEVVRSVRIERAQRQVAGAAP